MSEFAAELQRLLKLRNMTQKELADKSGVTEAAVSRYLNCERQPRAITVAAIAKALEVQPWELMGASKPEVDNIDGAVRLIARNAKSLDNAQREAIIRAIAGID